MLKFVKKIKFSSVFWLLFYIFIFGLLLQNSFRYLDPDLGWHLQVGKEIFLTNLVPHLNNYNYTFTGNWVDHEWLMNLITYRIYHYFGYITLSVLFSLLVLLTLGLLHFFIKHIKPQVNQFLLALLLLFGVISSLPHFGVRVQEISFLFLLLLLIIIYSYNKYKKYFLLLLLLPLFYLWANLHGGFLLGLAVLFLFIGVKLIEKIFYNKKVYFLDFSRVLKYKEILTVSLFTGASILVTFLTPYHLKLYSFLAGYRNTFYLSHIQEWLSQFYFPFNYWQLLYLALVIAFLCVYLSTVFLEKKNKLNIWQFSLTIVFIVLSLKSRRNFPLFFLASFPLLIEMATIILLIKDRGKNFFNFWHKFFILTCLISVILSQAVYISFTNKAFSSYCYDYPCKAVKFLKDQPKYDQLHIFNEYNWGGFLIWTDPSRQLFIDGRLPQEKFAGHSFLEEYLDFFKKDGNYQQLLNKYNVKLILIRTTNKKLTIKKWEKIITGIKDKQLKNKNYLREYLNNSSKWLIVYQDKLATVYLKVK